MIPEPTPQQQADAARQAADTLARRGQGVEATISWLMANRYQQLADKEKRP